MKASTVAYLAQEAVLFLVLSYTILLGGTFNGLVLYQLNLVSTGLLAAIGGFWLAWRWLRRWPAPRTALDGPLAALLAAHVIATVFSSDPRRSAGATLLVLLYVLAFYLAVDLLRAGWPASLAIKVLLLVSGFVLFFGLWEFERWYSSWIAIGGWANPFPPATIRLRSFLGHPNSVAAFFTLLLPLALAAWLQAHSRASRLMLAVWTAATLVVVFLTSSRGGWLSTAVALAVLAGLLALDRRERVVAAWQRLRARPQLLGVGVFAALAGLVPVGWLLYWQSQHPTHGGRSSIWGVAWDMFVRDPLTGGGPFTFATDFMAVHSVPPTLLLTHAHNYYLNTLAETGLLGALALLAVMVAAARLAWRRWNEAQPGGRAFLLGPLAALAGLLVNSIFDTPQLFPALMLIVALLMALVAAGDLRAPASAGPGGAQRPRARPPLPWVANSLLTAGYLALAISLAWSLNAYRIFSDGVVAGNLGRWPLAAARLEQAVAQDPGEGFYWLQAGYAHGRLALDEAGQMADEAQLRLAIRDFERGMEHEPTFATNWANLALLHWARGDQASALAAMERAAGTAPLQPAFGLTLGRMREAAGDEAGARAAYLDALDVQPEWADAFFFRATPLRAQAAAEWAAARAGQPADELDRAWAALAAGDLAGAEQGFEQARSVNAPEPYLGLGRVYLAQGRYALAEHTLQTALFTASDVNYTTVRIHLALGEVRAQQGAHADAAAHYQQGIDVLERTTSFGLGRLGSAEYGWYAFNRASLLADLLPGIDYIVYTGEMVDGLMALGNENQALGNREAAAWAFCRALEAAPDDARAQAAAAQAGGCSAGP